MPDLHLSNNFAIPADAVTQTFAILAKRGVGKTYTASVLVEELVKAGLHAVVVDPIGVWWGCARWPMASAQACLSFLMRVIGEPDGR